MIYGFKCTLERNLSGIIRIIIAKPKDSAKVSDWTLTMGENEQMPKVDLVKDKANISRVTVDYMKILEKENLHRVEALKKLRQRNIRTGFILGTGVLGIYLYTIFSVRQEKFLDDFDEPAITSN